MECWNFVEQFCCLVLYLDLSHYFFLFFILSESFHLQEFVTRETPFDSRDPERVLRDPVTLMKYSVGVNQVR